MKKIKNIKELKKYFDDFLKSDNKYDDISISLDCFDFCAKMIGNIFDNFDDSDKVDGLYDFYSDNIGYEIEDALIYSSDIMEIIKNYGDYYILEPFDFCIDVKNLRDVAYGLLDQGTIEVWNTFSKYLESRGVENE